MDISKQREQVDSLVASGRIEEAVGMLGKIIDTYTDSIDTDILSSLYFHRGKLYWRMGRRAEATSDYAKSTALKPDGPASKALEQAHDVADFFNPDLYNP